MSYAALVYRYEYFADKVQTVPFLELYNKQLLIQKHEKTLAKYRNHPISEENIRNHLEIEVYNASFQAFNAYVNTECDKAITALYGKFSPLSSPILTQWTLS